MGSSLTRSTQSLVVKIESCDINLVNDCTSMESVLPLLRLSLDSVAVDVVDWSATAPMKVFFHSRLKTDYYNQGLEVWEPIIENFGLQCTLKRDKATSKAAYLKLHGGAPKPPTRASKAVPLQRANTVAVASTPIFQAASTLERPLRRASTSAISVERQVEDTYDYSFALMTNDLLNINVTAAFLETVAATATAISTDFKQNRRSVLYKPLSHSCYIRNQTGVPLFYKVSDQPTPNKVAADAEEPLSISLNRSSKAKRVHVHTKQVISLALDQTDFIDNIPVDEPSMYKLWFLLQDKRLETIFEVSFNRGSKILTLRSPLLFANSSTIPVKVLIEVRAIPNQV